MILPTELRFRMQRRGHHLTRKQPWLPATGGDRAGHTGPGQLNCGRIRPLAVTQHCVAAGACVAAVFC